MITGSGVAARLRHDPLRLALTAIAGITVASGLGQLAMPAAILDLLGADTTAAAQHFFAIVGMFMAVIGALTAQALLAHPTPSLVIGWAAVQKAGASVAVTVGVAREVFAPMALAVAVFDLATAALGAVLWLRLRRGAA